MDNLKNLLDIYNFYVSSMNLENYPLDDQAYSKAKDAIGDKDS